MTELSDQSYRGLMDALKAPDDRWAPAQLLDDSHRPVCDGLAIRPQHAYHNPADPRHTGLAGIKLANGNTISAEAGATLSFVEFADEDSEIPICHTTLLEENQNNQFAAISFFYRDLVLPGFNSFA